MEAGSSRSGGMPQVRCSASASQNVPGVRYLQRPRSQGRQVCGSGQVNSFVSSREGSIASLPLLLSGSFIRFYGRCCTPRRRPIDKAASLVKYTMHMVFLSGASDHFCVAKVLLQKRKTPMWVSFFFVIAHRFCCLYAAHTAKAKNVTRLDSLPASHEWRSHSQEPCRTS